jgi:hypothetical protein
LNVEGFHSDHQEITMQNSSHEMAGNAKMGASRTGMGMTDGMGISGESGMSDPHSSSSHSMGTGTMGTGMAGNTGAGNTGAGMRENRDGDVRETHRLIASDKVEGTSVCRSSGDKIGSIERLMIEKTSGKVVYAVMSFGGFLGIGEDYYTLPWSVLKYNTELDAYEVNLTEEQLSSAPRQSDMNTTSYDSKWENDVHDHYKATPYWGM